MPHKEVRKTLGDLKSELEQTPKETGFLEEKLEQAREGIERYTPEAIQELVQTLQREAEEFEVEHPRVTALINQVATALSNLATGNNTSRISKKNYLKQYGRIIRRGSRFIIIISVFKDR